MRSPLNRQRQRLQSGHSGITTLHIMPRGRLGCFFTVIFVFSAAAVGTVLNIWFSSWKIRPRGGGASSLARKKSNEPLKPKRVAVCFFGLTRSLRWTLPSIERRLLGVLRDSRIDVDVFVHTYHLVEVNNNRAGEVGIDYHEFEDDFRALNATRSSVTNQDEFDRVWPDPLSLTKYHWGYKEKDVDYLIRNVFRAYWSMATAWSLLLQHSMETNTVYDAVVLARPDVWFHVDIDLSKRTFPLSERTVYLPSFDADTDIRKNDRFAYGSMTSMGVMMNRISTLRDPKAGSVRGKIDSEWVLGLHLKKHEIKVEMIEFPVTRVRLTGDIQLFDQVRVEEACASGDDPVSCKMVELGFKMPIKDT